MKLAVVSDIHFDLFSDYDKPIDDKPYGTRLNNTLSAIKDVFNFCIDNKYDYLVFNGDVFNQRQSVSPIVTDAVVRLIGDYVSKAVEANYKFILAIVVGNHDEQTNADTFPNSVNMLKYLSDHIEVFDECGELTDDDITLHFVPYYEHAEIAKKYLKAQSFSSKHNYVFAHVGANGAKNGRWNHKLGGSYSLEDLRYKDSDFVFLGHYHWRQNLADNVAYTGDPVQINFNDEGQDKGFYTLDTEKDYMPEFKKLDYPKFVTLDADKDNINEAFSSNPKNYYRVTTSDKDTYDALVKIRDSHDVNAKLVYKPVINKDKTRLEVKENATPFDYLNAYSNKLKLDKDVKEESEKIMRELV